MKSWVLVAITVILILCGISIGINCNINIQDKIWAQNYIKSANPMNKNNKIKLIADKTKYSKMNLNHLKSFANYTIQLESGLGFKKNQFEQNVVDFSAYGMEYSFANNLPESSLNNLIGESAESSVIYISNNGNNQLISCNVSKTSYNPATTTGSNYSGEIPTGIYNCIVWNNLQLNSPENLAIANNNLFIVNFATNLSYLTQCNLGNGGQINSCSKFNLNMESAAYINVLNNQLVISSFPDKGVAMITNCLMNSSDVFLECYGKSKIAANLIPGNTINGFEYSTNFTNNAINKCINGRCQLIMNPLIINPLTIYVSENTAYIGNDNNTLVGCGVDQNTGYFFDCALLATGLDTPLGITQFDYNSN